MSRKSEIKEAETYALSQLRALIGNALECDVEGSFEHEDGSEWDAERIAEVRRLSEWARETTLKGADDVPTYCRWADATSPAAVLSLLDALEEARRERGVLADAREGWRNAVKDAVLAMRAQAGRHAQQLQNAEELGYERGLRDGLAMMPGERSKLYADAENEG